MNKLAGGGLSALAVLLLAVNLNTGSRPPTGTSARSTTAAQPSVASSTPQRASTVPSPEVLPCTAKDNFDVRFEINQARARGQVSACEWRPGTSPDVAARPELTQDVTDMVPCTATDSIGMHLEIDRARIRGQVSACESRPGATDIHGYVTVDDLTRQLPRAGMSSAPVGVPALPPGTSLTGPGTFVLCGDGTTSTAGGKQGACSYHGGVR